MKARHDSLNKISDVMGVSVKHDLKVQQMPVIRMKEKKERKSISIQPEF